MEITVGKILSVVVAMAYVLSAILSAGKLAEGFKMCLVMVIPLTLVWFPDLGDVRGWAGRGSYIDTDSPPFLISFLGWCFLLGMPLLWYFLR